MRLKLCWILVAAVVVSVVSGGQDHQNQGYFQYANVPAHGQYEFGYNRGNPSHYTSRYEQGHNWRFRTKVRWGDKKGGYGEHYWDYNHVDKGKGNKGHGYGQEQQGHGWPQQPQTHGHQQSAYSEIAPALIPGRSPQNQQLAYN